MTGETDFLPRKCDMLKTNQDSSKMSVLVQEALESQMSSCGHYQLALSNITVTQSILSAQLHFIIKRMAHRNLPDAYKRLQKPPLPLTFQCM